MRQMPNEHIEAILNCNAERYKPFYVIELMHWADEFMIIAIYFGRSFIFAFSFSALIAIKPKRTADQSEMGSREGGPVCSRNAIEFHAHVVSFLFACATKLTVT